MKDKKHFLDHHHHHHHHDATTAAAASSPSPSSSSPPLYPSLHHPPPFSPTLTATPTTDGATVELPRRRRGRPPGSKNKPKPPTAAIISPNPASPSPNSPYALQPSMRTLLLQIEPDNDVVDSISRFCRKKSISLSLLSASGTLSHFTLRHPASPPSVLTFRGRFDILSISATVVSEGAGGNNSSAASSFYLPSGFTLTVSGPQGQVVGGAVGGPVVAAGPVFVVAASFEKPSYHRLPAEDEDEDDEGEKGEASEVAATVGGGGGVGFGCHLGGSDVVWAPVAARPPY